MKKFIKDFNASFENQTGLTVSEYKEFILKCLKERFNGKD